MISRKIFYLSGENSNGHPIFDQRQPNKVITRGWVQQDGAAVITWTDVGFINQRFDIEYISKDIIIKLVYSMCKIQCAKTLPSG